MKGDNKGNIGDFVEAERTTSDKNPNSILFHENNLNPNYTRHQSYLFHKLYTLQGYKSIILSTNKNIYIS